MTRARKAARAVLKRADRGLFAGRGRLSGNNVSESNNRTRRSWKPNVQRKSLYSEALGEMVRLRVTTHALRCVEKAGGLDRYILDTPERKLDSAVAMDLRETIRKALADKQL